MRPSSLILSLSEGRYSISLNSCFDNLGRIADDSQMKEWLRDF